MPCRQAHDDFGINTAHVVVTGQLVAATGIINGQGCVKRTSTQTDGVIAILQRCKTVPDIFCVIIRAAAD